MGLFAAAPVAVAAGACHAQVDELDRLAQSQGPDAARLNALKMMRDMGARQCDKGDKAAANPILDSQVQVLSRQAEDDDADAGIPKSKLAVACLRGIGARGR